MKNNKMQVCPGCSVNTWDRLSLTSGTTAALSAAPCQTRPGHSRHIQGPSGAAALLAGGVSAGFTAAGAVGVHLEQTRSSADAALGRGAVSRPPEAVLITQAGEKLLGGVTHHYIHPPPSEAGRPWPQIFLRDGER